MSPLYQIFITRDGSPTLIYSRPNGDSEHMHHSGGALSESFYIYHEALLAALKRQVPLRIVSLGLGAGYNEWIALAEISRRKIEGWKLWSFESEDILRNGFLDWLNEVAGEGLLPTAFSEVLERVAQRFEIEASSLKNFARKSLESGQFEFRKKFPEDLAGVAGCTCVFYDAFSNRMDPSLWEQLNLESALKQISASEIVFASYAATGDLSRALKRLGFRLTRKDGFSGKRESTLAIRSEIR